MSQLLPSRVSLAPIKRLRILRKEYVRAIWNALLISFDHFCFDTQCLSASQPQELYTDLDQDDAPDSESDEKDPDQEEEEKNQMAEPVGVPELDIPEVEVPEDSSTVAASLERQILAKQVQLAEIIDVENQEPQMSGNDVRHTISALEARIELLKGMLGKEDDKPSLGFELIIFNRPPQYPVMFLDFHTFPFRLALPYS